MFPFNFNLGEAHSRIEDCSTKSEVRATLQQILIQRLTYCDNISVCIIHSNIVFLCPLQADFCPGLELLMLPHDFFPLGHKLLEIGHCMQQNWCGFRRHALLKCVRNLLLHERLSMGSVDDSHSRLFLTLPNYTN